MHSSHSGRTLFEHLLGTYLLLKEWDQPEPVCLAGLFHSIYGTNVFALPLPMQRTEVKEAIGAEAEELAWLFCVVERPKAIVQGLQNQTPFGANLATRRDLGMDTPRSVAVNPRQMRALAEIECANLMEQGSWGNSLRKFYCIATDRSDMLSPLTISALSKGWASHLKAQKSQHHEVQA